MKIFILIGLIVAMISTGSVWAATPVKKGKHKIHHKRGKIRRIRKIGKVKKVKQTRRDKGEDERANLSTDISFDDSILHGRYDTPDEANIRVENEKILSDLLAVRTNFKDRLKKSSEQN